MWWLVVVVVVVMIEPPQVDLISYSDCCWLDKQSVIIIII